MTPTSRIVASVRADGAGEITVNGDSWPIAEASLEEARTRVIREAATVAGTLGRPVQVLTHDPSGSWPLLVYADATVESDPQGTLEEPAAPADGANDSSTLSLIRGDDTVPAPGARRAWDPAPVPPPPPATTASERESFITAGRTIQPATQGMRGALNRVGFRMDPGHAEQAYRDDVKAVAQHWPGPRTIAVVNGKGSANKTPTTACLAAIFARLGGAGVLAWDNNETRGSLPWRTETSPHGAAVLDLLPRVDALLAQTAQYAEMSHYVHHQPADKYDVLWSDQSVAGDHVVSAEDVERVHRVAARYYRLAIIDSGNSERAPNWRAMVAHTNRLVVPCTNVEDTAEAGARLLEALETRDEHSARLAREAVLIVSQRTPGRDQNMPRIVDGFRRMGLTVVTVPFDPALKTGVIRFDAFRPATQRAWLAAAAAVARGL